MVHMAEPPMGVFSGPRFNDLLAQYIAACGGAEHAWVRCVDATAHFDDAHLHRFNTTTSVAPCCSARDMERKLAVLLLDVLITVACTKQRVIIAPVETVYCDVHAQMFYLCASFLHRGDADSRPNINKYTEERLRTMIFDAYRRRNACFAPFDNMQVNSCINKPWFD